MNGLRINLGDMIKHPLWVMTIINMYIYLNFNRNSLIFKIIKSESRYYFT